MVTPCINNIQHFNFQLWLPEDGFLVNRNMLEQLYLFKMF